MHRLISVFQNWTKQVLFLLFVLIAGGWLFAAAIRLTVRDLSEYWRISLLYYATPGPLLLVVALGLAGLALLAGHRRGTAAWLLIAFILPHCGGSHATRQALVDVAPLSSTQLESLPRHRLMYWNVSHLDRGLWGIAEEIKAAQPDVVALVEAGPASEEYREVWKKHFPAYDVTFLGAEMMVMVKGEVEAVRVRTLPKRSNSREADLRIGTERLTLILVDIQGDLGTPRNDAIQELTQQIFELSDRPLLVAGDFNLPRDSPLFKPMEGLVSNVFDLAGQGYAPTWPLPTPVMTIDQVWGNCDLHFYSCRAGWTQLSDHRPILADFSLRP